MAIKTYPFDAAEFLNTPEAVEEFLVASFESAFELDDPRLITNALGVVARAKGMAKMAEDTELSRTALYRALSAEGRPELATIFKVMQALGMQLAPVLKKSAMKSAA
jgi:probable addiction module antidote protein